MTRGELLERTTSAELTGWSALYAARAREQKQRERDAKNERHSRGKLGG